MFYPYQKSISYILSGILFSNMVYADGIVIDTKAAAKYQASIESTANNIPLINIVTPNTRGLSHNKFREFNISPSGIIFNNATSASQTQLAGWVQGNANLGSTPAKAILNEVTGTNRSFLRGYGEVAGHKADVIIANPNGITVNGGGFINTPRATLTTGNPRFHGDMLNGFDVKKGDILIEGDGFNASNIDKVDLYTKALQLNASLYAKTLDAVTGVNSIDLDGTITPDNTIGTEAFSIDSSALGGIYADTIRLSATQKGVGVNLPPITYASNSLELRADGKIILSNIVADKTISVSSQSADVVLTKDITAHDISLFAKKEISVPTDSVVKALNNLSMNAQEALTNDGEINALLGIGSTLIQTENLFNNGLIGGYDVNVGSAVTDNTGAIYSKNNLLVSGKTLDNSGVIRSNNNIELLVEESLTNHKNGTVQSDGSMLISAHAKTNTIHNLGVIQSGDAMTIIAKELNNIAHSPTINTVTSTTTSKVSQGGSNDYDMVTVTTTTDVITAQSTPAQILSQGDMSIDAEKLNNSYSLIASDENLYLTAGEAKNIGSVLVETTVTTTVKYRDQKYCAKKVFGACLDHKHRAAYGGTFSQTATKRTALSNAGIQAKKSILGNVLTLSNLTDQLSGVMDAQQIVANLATIDVLESSSYKLQESLSTLQNSSDVLVLNGEDNGIETIIADALDKSDMTSFSSNLLSLTTQLKQDIADAKVSIASLENTTASIKAKNYDTSSLELTTTQLKKNLLLSEGHLSDIETLQASLKNTNDLSLHKQELLSSDQAIKTLLLANAQTLGTLDVIPIANALQADADTLRATVNSALELRSNVEYKVITQDEGLYQTNTHHTLASSPTLSYNNSRDASLGDITLPHGKYGLFLTNKDLAHPYLIERNPLFTDYNTFISSDYLLDKLGFDPDRFMKRLGDGAYETKLVRESVMRLSGSRYLSGYNSDNEQYLALMDNALRIQSSLGLVVGVALSKEQIAALDDDIVWLQEIEIEGIKVLAPRVYIVSQDTAGPNITADTISLNINSALTNDGVIHANSTLALAADTITNTNGTLSSGDEMRLEARRDLVNTSGTLVSGGDMTLYSGGAITNSVTSKQMEYKYAQGYQTSTQKGKASNIISGGSLLMEAGGDINIIGSSVQADKDAALLSSGNINAEAFESKEAYDFRLRNGYTKGNSQTNNISNITAANLLLGANNINITSSSLKADTALELMARENINILSNNDLTFTDTKLKSSSGVFGSKTTQNTSMKESVISSTLNASNISMLSGKDTTLQAANLKAQETIQVDAAGDINALAKEYREAELHYSKKKGFGGLSSSVSLNSTDAVKLHEATLKTEAKNIIMNSGKDINVVASNVSAGNLLGLKASKNINILSDEEKRTEEHYSRKTGISLGFSDNMLTFAEDKRTSNTNANITQKNSMLSGNTIAIEAGQDVSTIGSNIIASTIDVNAQRDVNLLSATESATHEHKKTTAKNGIGVTLNINEASIFAGMITKSDKLGEGQTQEVGSGLIGDNITVHSGNNTNILASNVLANNDVSIQSDKNINILSQDATAYKNQVHEELKAGIKVGVQQHVTDAAKQLVSNAKSLPKSDNTVNAASTVMRSIDLVSNTLSHSVSAGFDAIAEMSKSEISSQSISAQSSTIAAGRDVTLGAANKITIAGSDIMAENKISMDAQTITLKSSEQTASSSASDKSGSLKVTLFGTHTGQVDASYAQSKNRSNDTLQRDTYVSANDIAITTSGDTTLQGAHVLGNTVTANVGGNLNLISVQDTGSSKGDKESIGLSTAGSVSIGAGKSSSSKAWVEEQTGIIATKQADISVNGNTDLKGSIIATIDANGNDVNNIHLTTGALTTSDITDHDKSTSMSIGLGNISASSFQTDSHNSTGGTLEAGYAYSDKEQINRATIGGGTITLTNQESLPSNLNRDISKAQEITKNESENYDIYASQNSINSVLNPAQTAENWKQAAKDMGLSMHKEITENLPNSNSEGFAGVVGKALDTAEEYVPFGLLPTQANGGGYVTQIATQLFGDNRNILQTTDEAKFIALGLDKNKGDYSLQTIDGKETYVTNLNKTVRLNENGTKDGNLDDMKLYVDAAKATELGLNSMFTNGIMNKAPEAMTNQIQQQGSPSIVLLNYNPSHGIAGDTLQMTQEKVAIMTNQDWLATGSARQTGDIKTQLTELNNGNLNTAAHSQGTMQDYLGTRLNQEQISKVVQSNPDAKFTTQYNGAPVSSDAASQLMNEIYGGVEAITKRYDNDLGILNIFKSSVNPGDAVAILGGNTAGINNQNEFWKNFSYDTIRGLPTLFNGGLEANLDNPDKTSSHSGYKCVIGCGDSGVTTKKDFYYDFTSKDKQTPLQDFYLKIKTDPSYSNVYHPENISNKESK